MEIVEGKLPDFKAQSYTIPFSLLIKCVELNALEVITVAFISQCQGQIAGCSEAGRFKKQNQAKLRK